MTQAPGIGEAVRRIARDDRGRLLAALIRSVGDFDLAEDALSEAFERALVHWRRTGLPERPDAWLLTAARRRAIDRIRAGRRRAARTPDIALLMEEDEEARSAMPEEIPDERLRLIFTCCHPALEEKTRVALTLRTVCGLTTREIARAFLDAEAAMGQRLSRAKAKIGAAAIPYRVPERAEWDARLGAVLTVIYLVFNEGWTAGPGEAPIRTALCDEAIWLARLMTRLAPGEAEIEGLLALMLTAHARRRARTDAAGVVVPLEAQDRRLWDGGMIAEGLTLLDAALARGRPGPFQLQAAIGACHVAGDTPDWRQIALLYDRLHDLQPTPVVALNRAVARAEAGRLEEALAELRDLAGALDGYQPYHAALAELAARAGERREAEAERARAIDLSRSPGERAWLAARSS